MAQETGNHLGTGSQLGRLTPRHPMANKFGVHCSKAHYRFIIIIFDLARVPIFEILIVLSPESGDLEL